MADNFDSEIQALSAALPVALLPVRLEARFFDSARELRVRIYPDQIHVDAHEPRLTAAERDAGVAYWQQRCATPNPAQRGSDAWGALAGQFGAARAAWVAQALTPTNLPTTFGPTSAAITPTFPDAPLQDAAWSSAACAAALPRRWLAIGRRGGATLFRKWSSPVVGPLDLTPTPLDDNTPLADDALPLQDTARWMVDFDAAERAGMALRIVTTDLPSPDALAAGLDRLVVLGAASGLSPTQGADTLRTLLGAHLHTDGLSALRPGTPTNVSRDSSAGAAPDATALTAALDPEKRPTASAYNSSGGDRLWRALGFGATVKDLLSAIPGATGFDAITAGHLSNALWESTLGAWLVDFLSPLVDDAAAAALRDHVRKHLVPGGPLPALRIGRQPYGVLPVVAADRFVAVQGARAEEELMRLLRQLRVLWGDAATRVPRLGASADLDADLTRILQGTPQSARYQWRPVLGPLGLNATQGLERHASAQETLTGLLGMHLGWQRRPDIAGFAAHPQARPLRSPLIDVPATAPDARLSRNYLSEIATAARSDGTWEGIKAREDAKTLLEALAVHAVARELHRADMRTLDRQRLASGAIAALPARGVMAASEYVGIEAVTRPTASAGALITTPSEAARCIVPTITGEKTVRQFVTAAVARGVKPVPDVAVLADILASLEFLAARSVGELDRALRGWLDACAFRLDAWFTSLAQRRLSTLRTAQPAGVHVGGYGWLDDLQPDASPQATTQGYLHAPSLAQAATAAVLRSGHLAHRDAEHQALQIDLHSDRVRRAAKLLDGVAAGQPLAALLGYRIERALRERSLLLAKYILPLRLLFPLRPTGETTPAPSGPSETIAARDVVDGVALLQAWRDTQAALFTRLAPPPDAADLPLLADELNRLADLYDAVADLMVAEAVHQNVLGNNERAGAVIAALDRQERPPSLDFMRTPRSGISYTQRLLVLIGDALLPAPWATLGGDLRGRAEPRLNAWIARLLGAPTRFVFAANVRTGGTVKALKVALPALGLSPLSLVMASRGSAQHGPSELDARVLLAFAALVTAPKPDTEIELLDAPAPVAGALGLGALRALLKWIHALVTGQRPATAQDLALPADVAAGERSDPAELAQRTQAVADIFGAALAGLRTLQSQPGASAAALRGALTTAAAFGLHEALPAPPGAASEAAAGLAALHVQCNAMVAELSNRDARQQALVAQLGGAMTARAAVKLHTERLRVLLGEGFPVLPLFGPGRPSELAASLAARATLLGGDEPAPLAWLQRMGLVRDDTARLAAVMQGAELTGGDVTPASLAVMQLPAQAGERWLALPFGAAPATAELAIAAAVSGTLDPAQPWAGLFVDAWPETIPAREETTGIAFHHDAPGARAPQAVLLAVPPDAAAKQWTTDDLLATIDEAHDLARLRGVGPQELRFLGTLLPALLLPASLSTDVPAIKLEALAALATPSSGVLGKA
jgi:hypothetical protein